MISTIVYRRSNKQYSSITDVGEISELRADANNILWVDVQAPTAADFLLLEEEFSFHHLAIEDCQQSHQRPKIEEYHGYYFIVLYDAIWENVESLIFQEINIFIGANYVITIHRHPVSTLKQGENLWREWTDIADLGAGVLAYLLIDSIVDQYFPILDSISDRLELLEELLFENSDAKVTQEIFQLKKQLLQMRRSVTPLRDVFNVLLRREQPLFQREILYYFHDIYDHLIRVADTIDSLRELLGSTMDLYLSLQSNRMNMVMKRLTALSTILMSAALISGIYGMNFAHMPELQWHYGYFIALVGMLGLVVILVAFFRWIKWL